MNKIINGYIFIFVRNKEKKIENRMMKLKMMEEW